MGGQISHKYNIFMQYSIYAHSLNLQLWMETVSLKYLNMGFFFFLLLIVLVV